MKLPPARFATPMEIVDPEMPELVPDFEPALPDDDDDFETEPSPKVSTLSLNNFCTPEDKLNKTYTRTTTLRYVIYLILTAPKFQDGVVSAKWMSMCSKARIQVGKLNQEWYKKPMRSGPPILFPTFYGAAKTLADANLAELLYKPTVATKSKLQLPKPTEVAGVRLVNILEALNTYSDETELQELFRLQELLLTTKLLTTLLLTMYTHTLILATTSATYYTIT